MRELVAAARWHQQRGVVADLSHLTAFDELTVGPVQRDEALFLHALVRVVRPKTVLELGFLYGHSALNFLTALDDDARLYSLDINPTCERLAQALLGHDPRFQFRLRSIVEVEASDVDGRNLDLVFFDAGHDVDLSRQAFEQIEPLLAPDAILAVHDTGTVPRRLFPPGTLGYAASENWVGDEYEGQPGERAFVNWLLEKRPAFSQIHLHSRETIRCGITLLQRTTALARPPGE